MTAISLYALHTLLLLTCVHMFYDQRCALSAFIIKRMFMNE